MVEPHGEPGHLSVDTRISIADLRERRPDGSLPVKVIVLDSRSLGWLPFAMFIALWGATPLSWNSRWKTMALGLGGVLLFIAATVLASACAGMFQDDGWRQVLAGGAYHLLVENLWLSFVGPLLIWLGGVLWLCREIHPLEQPVPQVKRSPSRHR